LFTTTTFAVVIKAPSYCKNPVIALDSNSAYDWYISYLSLPLVDNFKITNE
jgi:hypothetical protein